MDMEQDATEGEKVKLIERAHNEKKITTSDELHTGDHLVFVFNDQIDYFHAILVGMLEIVNDEASILEIIFYNDEKFSPHLKELIEKSIYFNDSDDEKINKKLTSSHAVQRVKIIFDKNSSFEIYKVVYDESILNVLETIDKASKLIGEGKYNVFENNDEHFAHYCKTGKAGKLLLIDTSEIEAKEIFGNGIIDKMKHTIKKTGTNIVLFKVAQTIATRFPRNILASSLPTILKTGTPLLGYGLEGLDISTAFYKKYKETREGKLTDIKFKKFIFKRIGKSAMGITGGIVGGGIGQMWIPVPVVGAMVGGFIGGLIGSCVGYYQGILIGEVVESVDYKLHELLSNLSVENVHVLEENVLKIDDIHDFDYVVVNEEDCIDQSEQNKAINHEDYEIYLLEKDKSDENTKPNETSACETINLVINKPKID